MRVARFSQARAVRIDIDGKFIGMRYPYEVNLVGDPDIPPIPPHATFEQAKDAAMALLKGDPDRWGVLKGRPHDQGPGDPAGPERVTGCHAPAPG